MKLAEISQLIEVRNYTVNAVNNFNLNRDEGRELQKMLILLDKLIVRELLSPEFKKFVEFSKADEVMAEVVNNNNIKRDMNPSKDIVVSTGNKTEILKG
jgi:hypothetical protein